jgi:hypothetical protein
MISVIADHVNLSPLNPISMKKTKIALLALAISAAALLSFQKPATSIIKGTVTPAFYGVHAWAISEHDTLYTSISDGNFEFAINEPGTYRIVIEARSPYRHMAKDGIVVKEGQETDLGALSLQKWQ